MHETLLNSCPHFGRIFTAWTIQRCSDISVFTVNMTYIIQDVYCVLNVISETKAVEYSIPVDYESRNSLVYVVE